MHMHTMHEWNIRTKSKTMRLCKLPPTLHAHDVPENLSTHGIFPAAHMHAWQHSKPCIRVDSKLMYDYSDSLDMFLILPYASLVSLASARDNWCPCNLHIHTNINTAHPYAMSGRRVSTDGMPQWQSEYMHISTHMHTCRTQSLCIPHAMHMYVEYSCEEIRAHTFIHKG